MSSGKCRFRRSVVLAALAAAVVGLGFAASASGQTGPGTGSPGDPFEVYGRLYSGSAPAGFLLGDGWAQGASFAGVLDADGNAAVNPATGILFRAKRQVDKNWGNSGDGYDPSLFAGRNKNFDLIGVSDTPWDWDGGGGGPQKNDITNVYLHTRVDPLTGDRWVFVAAETRSIDGDSNLDFEFNQAGVVQTGTSAGQLIGLGPDGGRTLNDFIVSIDFTRGGEMPVASTRVWNGTGYKLLQIADASYSATNLVNILHGADGTWKHFRDDGAEAEVLTRLQLVEGGVNLTALGIEIDPCAPRATFLVKSRSSSSFTSDLKDFSLVYFPIEPPPEAEAFAPDRVCPGEAFEASVVETTGLSNPQYKWEALGCGTIVSDPNAPVVMVEAGFECDCAVTLVARVSGGECGNVAVAERTVTVRDDVVPVLDGVPPHETVECDSVPGPAVVTAADACDAAPAVQLAESSAAGACEHEWVITRTWTATDACGNSTSQDQVITVVDTTAPVLSVPADATVECDEDDQPSSTGAATATDNCDGSPAVTFADRVADGPCAQQSVITRTWTATDACGNRTSADQIITVVDTTPPVLTVPAAVTIECDEDDQPSNAGQATATDNCDASPTVTFADSVVGGSCAAGLVITRTWTATDACGNATSAEQIITVVDTSAPILTVPADVTIECDEDDQPSNTGAATATDSCDSSPAVSFTDSAAAGSCAHGSTITRTWTATDACGNSTTADQTITVVDTTAPVLTVPADLTIECDEDDQPSNTGEATALDNCAASPTVTFTDSVAAGSCAQGSVITRTWTATDACGNSASLDQVITVADTTPPVLSDDPADLTAECDSVPGAPSLTARDNCDADVPVVFSEETIPGPCTGSYTLARTWSATDECGNAAAVSQTVNVQDTTPPKIRISPNRSALYICDGPASAVVDATDNCGPVVSMSYELTADFPERVVLNDLGEGRFEVILTGKVTAELAFSAMDDCGNVGQAVFALSADCGDQACSPGFWRNHFEQWCATGFNPVDNYCFAGPATLFVDAFGITELTSAEIPASFDPEMTLLEAFGLSGGTFNQLLFQGTAALLNASNPEVDFPARPCDVKQLMQDAFAGVISMDEAKSLIGMYNTAERECGCPFSGGLPTTYECEGEEDPGPCPLEVAANLDGDADVDLEDFAAFASCFGGAGRPPAETCPGGVDADLDNDGDVDLDDFSIFATAYTGSQ